MQRLPKCGKRDTDNKHLSPVEIVTKMCLHYCRYCHSIHGISHRSRKAGLYIPIFVSTQHFIVGICIVDNPLTLTASFMHAIATA